MNWCPARSSQYTVILINPASWRDREIKIIDSKPRKTSFINSRRRWHKTRNSVDIAVKSWAAVAWICIKTSDKLRWCNLRHQQQLTISTFNRTWLLINRTIIFTRTINKEAWIASTFLNSSSTNNNRQWVVTGTTEWWQEIINSNRDDSGEGKVNQPTLVLLNRSFLSSTFVILSLMTAQWQR